MSSYKCSKCDYERETKGLVKKHVENVCKGAELIQNIVKVSCEICGKQYETKKFLEDHKKKCIEKKAFIVKEYVGADSINDSINDMKKLIEIQYEKIEKLEKSVKRIDNLEKEIKELTNKRKQ